MRAAAIALSVLSAIGGFAVAVILFVLGLAFTVGDNDKYGKVGLPGEAMVRLPEGDVLVYYEERAAYAATPPEGLRLVVRSAADREQVPARPVGNRSSYEINDVTGFSIARLQVPEEAASSWSPVGRVGERSTPR